MTKKPKTPLYLIAERGYAEVLQEILRTCISPADHGPCPRMALHATVIRNDIATSFHCTFGYVEIAKTLLIKDRSAAYKVDIDGDTALHVAAAHGRVYIMQEIVRAVVNRLITEDGMFFTMPWKAKIETQSDLFCKIHHLETL